MRRMEWESSYYPDINVSTSIPAELIQMYRSKWPRAYGYDPNGYGSATGIVSGTPKPFNWTISCLYQYIATPFCATRGSMNWSVNVSGQPVSHIRILRSPRYDPGDADAVLLIDLNPGLNGGEAYSNKISSIVANNCESGSAGSSLTNQKTQAGLNYVHPMYSKYKMYSTSPAIADLVDTYTDSATDITVLEVIANRSSVSTSAGTPYYDVAIDHYYSIGVDYNLLFFINVPTWFRYTSTPTIP